MGDSPGDGRKITGRCAFGCFQPGKPTGHGCQQASLRGHDEGQGDDAKRAKIIERTILKRMGTPEDIARTALFFAAQAPYVTGQVLPVDGGRSVGW